MCDAEITQDELMRTKMVLRCRVRTRYGWGECNDYTVTVAQARELVQQERARFADRLGTERPHAGLIFFRTCPGDEVIVAGIGAPIQIAIAGLTERA